MQRLERYNAKARASSAGGKKGKGKAKRARPLLEDNLDSNAPILEPVKDEGTELRRAQMRQELLDASQAKMTSKKKKRLESYINKKLRKEETAALLQKLAASQAQLPNSLKLQTSSSLGSGKTHTHQEKAARSEHKEVAQAVSGSALKRNADGTLVAPIVHKSLAKSKGRGRVWNKVSTQVTEHSETSFDSSESDSSSEESGSTESLKEGEDRSNDESTSGEEDEAHDTPTKSLGFKAWAMKQIDIARGQGTNSGQSVDIASAVTAMVPPPAKRRKLDHELTGVSGPLGVKLELPKTAFAKHLLNMKGLAAEGKAGLKLKSVLVSRSPEIQEARLQLPILAEEQPIMEAILLNPVVVLCGETGSGKTTQVPQFLYEAGFSHPDGDNPGMIGITQPRRVAAMAMAGRVANELAQPPNVVAYQVRYDANVSSATRIKFMTDGVLLRELATDFLLSRYCVIIVDEAHERSINTDILIGVLSRVVKLREEMWVSGKDSAKPLRLIIMSATLRVSDFAENKTLFPSPPPVIDIPARQHPVTIHFSRRTTHDYVTEAVKKAGKIHTRLPPGGILIFLTGQNEITSVCKKLTDIFAAKTKRASAAADYEGAEPVAATLSASHAAVETEEIDFNGGQDGDDGLDAEAHSGSSDNRSDEDEDEDIVMEGAEHPSSPMHVVPLYSLLASENQMRVFEPPPDGARLVVVATNVAETSITIPGIRYVIDSGRAKQRCYDESSGIQSFQVSWISKASAAQRAGRAGRTGPGHCYRLYSSALFEHHFHEFTKPEIFRMPIDGVVLQMKSMHIDAVVNFPFPTPPSRAALKKAETLLTHLGALRTVTLAGASGINAAQITDAGRAMALFPLSPRYAKMLVTGRQHGCLPYVIAIVAALSVGDPFHREEVLEASDGEDDPGGSDEAPEVDHIQSAQVREKALRKVRRRKFYRSQETHAALGKGMSDTFRLLSVVGAYEFAGGGPKFCADHFVRPKAMEEIRKLRAQLTSMVEVNFASDDTYFQRQLKPPEAKQFKMLRQLLTAAFVDQVAARKDLVQQSPSTGTKLATSRGVPYQAHGITEDVFMHPSSVVAGHAPPDFVVFQEVVRTSRPYIKGVTVINPAWLPTLCPSLVTYSKPLRLSSAVKDIAAGEQVVVPRFGHWDLPPVRKST